MKKLFKISVYTLISLAVLLLFFLMGLRLASPGKITPLVKENGSPYMNGLAEIERRMIGGVEQALIIRSNDIEKPVLLYIHGGPGSPEFPFMQHFNTNLEEFFTVCYWEQRGAGLSWSKDIPPESMTLEQFIEDGKEVSFYLAERFGKEKIYVMGHSWGTLLGSYLIHRYPEMYHAYFGIGQVGNQLASEQISYDFVLAEAERRGDRKAMKDLAKIGRPPYDDSETWMDALKIERKYVQKYGGSMKEGKFMKEAVTAIFNCREYRLKDKFNYMKANFESLQYLWGTVIEADLAEDLPEQKIPVYIFQGKYDYQTSYEKAREYFELLQAPEKQFFSFENSAHSPNFEETAKFEEIIGKLAASGLK